MNSNCKQFRNALMEYSSRISHRIKVGKKKKLVKLLVYTNLAWNRAFQFIEVEEIFNGVILHISIVETWNVIAVLVEFFNIYVKHEHLCSTHQDAERGHLQPDRVHTYDACLNIDRP